MKGAFRLVLLGTSVSLAGLLSAAATSARSTDHGGSVPTVYFATLNGPSESPPNNSAATGSTLVELDPGAQTMRVRITFSGIVSGTTASHIHACTAVPGSGTAGVATQVPRFVGFPTAVTSGSYDNTFDLAQASTYNPAFVTAQGSLAAAETALTSCIASGQAYLNIHSTAFPGGEIRGFLAPLTRDACKDRGYGTILDPRTGDFFRNQGQCVSFVATGNAG